MPYARLRNDCLNPPQDDMPILLNDTIVRIKKSRDLNVGNYREPLIDPL